MFRATYYRLCRVQAGEADPFYVLGDFDEFAQARDEGFMRLSKQIDWAARCCTISARADVSLGPDDSRLRRGSGRSAPGCWKTRTRSRSKEKKMADFKYEIIKEITVLSSSPKTGWNRELNFVSWNGNPPKLDIRDWSPDHGKMGKGITLSHEETAILLTVLNDLSLDELFGV